MMQPAEQPTFGDNVKNEQREMAPMFVIVIAETIGTAVATGAEPDAEAPVVAGAAAGPAAGVPTDDTTRTMRTLLYMTKFTN